MGVQVQFDYNGWVARYPEFTYVGSNLAQEYFTEATLYHKNDGSGPINDPNQQLMLLNMVTAHIAQLYKIQSNQAESQLVGRIDNAGEGSVNVSSEMAEPTQASDWWKQTKYGASYWAATKQFRMMRYRFGPRRIFNLPYGGIFR